MILARELYDYDPLNSNYMSAFVDGVLEALEQATRSPRIN